MLKAHKYRELCAEIHRKFGRKLGLPYWQSCELASEILQGESTREAMVENLNDALVDQGLEICVDIMAGKYDDLVKEIKRKGKA